MSKPLLLDLFCGAGGASVGYSHAGFDVVGVDIEPQPRYPFRFFQADALHFPLEGFDAIHASPPCQRFTAGAARAGTCDLHPELIASTRRRLEATGVPFVIENVAGARSALCSPTMLCGTMFDLGVFRHRLFEAGGFDLPAPEHHRHKGRVGDGRYFTVTGHSGGSSRRDGWVGGTREDWRRAMGIDWMTVAELAEALPPAYTEYVGHHLLAALVAQAADTHEYALA